MQQSYDIQNCFLCFSTQSTKVWPQKICLSSGRSQYNFLFILERKGSRNEPNSSVQTLQVEGKTDKTTTQIIWGKSEYRMKHLHSQQHFSFCIVFSMNEARETIGSKRAVNKKIDVKLFQHLKDFNEEPCMAFIALKL